MSRKVTSEKKSRCFTLKGRQYRVEKSWHYLDNGEQYHYIHLYLSTNRLPSKRFAWVVKHDGSVVHL